MVFSGGEISIGGDVSTIVGGAVGDSATASSVSVSQGMTGVKVAVTTSAKITIKMTVKQNRFLCLNMATASLISLVGYSYPVLSLQSLYQPLRTYGFQGQNMGYLSPLSNI